MEIRIDKLGILFTFSENIKMKTSLSVLINDYFLCAAIMR